MVRQSCYRTHSDRGKEALTWRLFAGREMAVAYTFGATALLSYGGFWLVFVVIISPGGFQVVEAIESEGGITAFHNSFGFFLHKYLWL